MGAKPYGVIYRITNTVNGKVYIGQTKNKLTDRWREHQLRCVCRRLHYAIRKYGPQAFAIEQFATASSAEELHELEAHSIFTLQSHLPQFGYNLMLGVRRPSTTKRHAPACRSRTSGDGQTRRFARGTPLPS